MDNWIDSVGNAAQAMSMWEVIAVVLSIAYLVLATKEYIACWYCALASTAIFSVLLWDVDLLMESALNVYYMAMAIYGWRQWRYGGADHGEAKIKTLAIRQHVRAVIAIALLTGVSGYFLAANTQAAWPFVDSFTTWASVITTVMVAHKILENWLYWLVIDAVSIPLYMERGLYLTTILFAAYFVIAVIGYTTWRRQFAEETVEVGYAGS